jgi:hypothetical protein
VGLPQRNARHVRKLGSPNATQRIRTNVRKLGAPTHVRNANVRHVHTSASWAPQRNARHVPSWASPRLGATQRKACPQVGHPNATQGEFARWAPKRKTHPQRKRPHKGALGKKTSWRMDKNKFWLGGRLFNTASPRLGAPMQRRRVRKMGAQTQRKAHVCKMGAQNKNRSATKTSTQGSTRLKDELEDG